MEVQEQNDGNLSVTFTLVQEQVMCQVMDVECRLRGKCDF